MIAICPSQEKLKSLSLGQLSEEQSDELLTHLRTCQNCQLELSTIDAVEDTFVNQLRTIFVPEPDEFALERGCQIASARALAALASVETAAADVGRANVPERIGEYEIVHPLGHGGMGHVFLGRHTKLGRPVAVKFIAHHRRWDRTMQERFASEMKMIGGLNHANIVAAHDARDVDDLAVLVTEYIDGMDVGEIVRRNGQLKVADACAIVTEVCKALDYIDSKGLVHRDIKPSNIMVDLEGQVKLLDLGLARLQVSDEELGEFTATGQAIGTADYVAPEQINDGRNIDIRTDIYGLGCTFYKLLCGQAPFANDKHVTAFSKMNAHVAELAQPVDAIRNDLPDGLAQIIHQMLEKNPANRPQTAGEISDRLRAFVESADLRRLVEDSKSQPLSNQPAPTPQPAKSDTQPEARTFLFRRIPLYTAIAASLIGILFGLWMGITITVKKADGTQATVVIPDGSTAIVDSEGNIDIQLANAGGRLNIPKENVELQSRQASPDAENHEHPSLVRTYSESFSVGPESLLFDRIDITDFIDVFAVSKGNSKSPFGSSELQRKRIVVKNKVLALNSSRAGKTLLCEFDQAEHEALNEARLQGLAIEIEFHDASRNFLEDRMRMTGVWRTVMQRFKGKVAPHNSEDTVLFFRDEVVLFRDGWAFRFKMDLQPEGSNSGIKLREPSGMDKNALQLAIYRFLPSGRLEIAFSNDPQVVLNPNSIPGSFENADFFVRLEKVKTPTTETQRQAFAMLGSAEQAKVKFELYIAQLRPDGLDPESDDLLAGAPSKMKSAKIEGTDETIWLSPQPIVTNKDVLKAEFDPDGQQGLMVLMTLTDQAADRVYLATRRNIDNLIAVVIDGKVVCAPRIQSPIQKELAISGNFSKEQATRISEGVVPDIELPSELRSGQSANRAKSMKNLQQIALAFHNYIAAWKRFPASQNRISEGNSFSWRVAILPFLGHAGLYEQFHFDEPWDSEHNSKLLTKMPDVFRHPSATKGSIFTNYVGFAGDKSALGTNEGTVFADFRDGLSNTILLIEADTEIPWTKPEDLPFNAVQLLDFKRLDHQGFAAASADGSVRFLKESDVDLEKMKKWLTRAGGEEQEIPNGDSFQSVPAFRGN